ncbi:amidohydrolase family protein [Aestuariibius sp. 2305UL40-4]|uniref:amidohydrolase family protein n=1 Tax=Aestuariibius violaceus TaxID=3234132 RepID=UPI00398F6A3A
MLPGYGDQRGFELLVEAGFAVPQAIQIVTSNGADALGISHEVGRITPGLAADLVVLEGDLTDDPSIIRNVRLVFKDGVGFDPAALIADVEGQVGDR